MEHILDLRDIVPKKLPNSEELPVSKPLPNASIFVPPMEKKESELLSPQQRQALNKTFFFQRKDGTYFNTSAEDAHNIRTNRSLEHTFIGASDGMTYHRIMQDAYRLNASLIPELKRLDMALDMVTNQELEVLAMTPGKEQDQAKEIIKQKRENLLALRQQKSDSVATANEELESKAFSAELEVARKNGGKIPDFSVVGNQGGIEMFGGSKIYNG